MMLPNLDTAVQSKQNRTHSEIEILAMLVNLINYSEPF